MATRKSKNTTTPDNHILNKDAGKLSDKVTQVVDYGELPNNTPIQPTEEKDTDK